ncbi:SDR family oxidoreductase [Bifidobacterium sp.]|jgi:NAD(P)-dependent dehydrogenase (short-subunit alcohol dehydrogenase family)|uniref:SDR family oxidoreductase n=1 Tax=Bifidobacterium sp. TaxID=41200 RepID=UPI0025BB7687|nr:SDR family NAD(P)-dependent oxidoreductase [Bifidobacterium sp.]MCI1634603.1 SDR family oxidoreductase [Bifidobacterium sp.]
MYKKPKALVVSASVIAVLVIAALLIAAFRRQETMAPTSTADTSNSGQFGADSYNTPEVAEEMRWINENVEEDARFRGSKVLVTGSTAGIGQLAANYLIHRGFSVVAHARGDKRAADARRDLPGLDSVVVGDFNNLDRSRELADELNSLGPFDAVIHNAGIYTGEPEELLTVNVLSPYVLTALMDKPKQLIYLSSDLQSSGSFDEAKIIDANPQTSYHDTKLYLLTMSNYLAAHWSNVQVNAVTPGWVPTKMGFADGNTTTPDTLKTGYMTQVRLVEGEVAGTGQFLFKDQAFPMNPQSQDPEVQRRLFTALEQRTGVELPQ